jgi:hypothetical protein
MASIASTRKIDADVQSPAARLNWSRIGLLVANLATWAAVIAAARAII